MVYFMTKNCISVSGNDRGDIVRSKALKRCYEIPGYKDLPLEYKNLIYDKIIKDIESEV